MSVRESGMVAPGGEPGYGIIEVARRNWIQDAMLRYLVFIDDAPVGQLWTLQTGTYTVRPGRHEVRLCIQGRTAESGNVPVDVQAGSVRRLRTRGKGLKNFLGIWGTTLRQAAAPLDDSPQPPSIMLTVDS